MKPDGGKAMPAGLGDFYVTGGTLRPDAPSYVERQADKDLLDGLLKGEFCYVLTSRQMGKSSPMVRGQLLAHFATAFSYDGKRLVLGGADGTVQLFDASSGNEVARLRT